MRPFNNFGGLVKASPKYWHEHCKNTHKYVIMNPKYERETLKIGHDINVDKIINELSPV
jgi:hypothetical protein